MLIKLNKWSCPEIRMQDEVTVQRLIIVPLKEEEQYKNLGTNLTNQISIQEEIKSILKSGNVCHLSV